MLWKHEHPEAPKSVARATPCCRGSWVFATANEPPLLWVCRSSDKGTGTWRVSWQEHYSNAMTDHCCNIDRSMKTH